MKVKISRSINSKNSLIVIPVIHPEEKNYPKKNLLKSIPENYPDNIREFLKNLIKTEQFKARPGDNITSYLTEKSLPAKLNIVGLGRLSQVDNRALKSLGAKIGRKAKALKTTDLEIFIPKELTEKTPQIHLGILMSLYETDKFKSKKKKDFTLNQINFITNSKSKTLEKELEKSELIAQALDFTKDLVNSPSNKVDGEYLARITRQIAKKNRYKVAVLGEKQLKKMGWGGLLAVNQGAEKEAKCLVLQYDGAKKRKEKPIVIVGKGIIFDTGGYNLKPTNHIETMHQDMAGGATVLGLFSVLKKLDIKKNVVGIIPIAENLISNKSYRPSDIITMYNGKTVEVTNTDAEGRLILADAITYGTQFKPEYLLTIATLTGAVFAALGDRYAGLVGNDDQLAAKIKKAGDETDDPLWQLPLPEDYKKALDSKVADIRNYDLGTGRGAGSSKAAAFLERFVEKNKWCHIDIGGTAFTDNPKEYQSKGATGQGLQTLIHFLEGQSN